MHSLRQQLQRVAHFSGALTDLAANPNADRSEMRFVLDREKTILDCLRLEIANTTITVWVLKAIPELKADIDGIGVAERHGDAGHSFFVVIGPPFFDNVVKPWLVALDESSGAACFRQLESSHVGNIVNYDVMAKLLSEAREGVSGSFPEVMRKSVTRSVKMVMSIFTLQEIGYDCIEEIKNILENFSSDPEWAKLVSQLSTKPIGAPLPPSPKPAAALKKAFAAPPESDPVKADVASIDTGILAGNDDDDSVSVIVVGPPSFYNDFAPWLQQLPPSCGAAGFRQLESSDGNIVHYDFMATLLSEAREGVSGSFPEVMRKSVTRSVKVVMAIYALQKIGFACIEVIKNILKTFSSDPEWAKLVSQLSTKPIDA